MPSPNGPEFADQAASSTVPIVHETVTVGVHAVETVRARIHVTVSEHDETVEQLLTRQNVTVERVPVGQTVSEAPPTRREGDVLIMPIMEEILVVEKRLVVREELRIRISEAQAHETKTVTVRRENAQIDRGDPTAQQTGENS